MLKIIPRILLIVGAVLVLGCALQGQQALNQLDIIPDGGGTVGRIKLIESTGFGGIAATQGISLEAAASIASDFKWTFPNANPGATNCLEVTTGGQIQYAAGACGVSGDSHPIPDTTAPLEDDSTGNDLFFQLSALTTARTLTVQDANYTLAGTNITNLFNQDQTIDNAFLIFTGAGTDYRFDQSNTDGLIVETTGGSDIVYFQEQTSTLHRLILLAPSGATSDFLLRIADSTEANGFQIRWDQSPSDELEFQLHDGTDLMGLTASSLAMDVDFTTNSAALAGLGTPADGTSKYCTDCLKGSDPCTASSTGAFAARVNGAWQCM